MNMRSEMILDAKLIMRDGLIRIAPDTQLNEKGYVENWEQNLFSDVDSRAVEADFRGKGGSELDNKFKAAHSSAALAVNSFAFFRDRGEPLDLPGFKKLQLDGFEKLFPTGLKRKPPHLDAAAQNDELLLAIESKCLEYFASKPAVFADSYVEEISDERRDGPWYAEMMQLRDDPSRYWYLDAAQLIKHAFGIAHTVKGKPVALLYIFWEPDDARCHSMFAEHRSEVDTFADRISGGRPAFTSMSYPELWAYWAESGTASLQAHAERLQSRYGGMLGSYEGYSRGADGRKTDAGFWGDLDID